MSRVICTPYPVLFTVGKKELGFDISRIPRHLFNVIRHIIDFLHGVITVVCILQAEKISCRQRLRGRLRGIVEDEPC
jgi:hypothetical protein